MYNFDDNQVNAVNEYLSDISNYPDWWFDGTPNNRTPYMLDCADIDAICYGGCESGAFMPAVTYHIASEWMNQQGDNVLDYIESCLGELPNVDGESWSGMACKYLSCAVELFAGEIVAMAENGEFDDE